MAARKKSPTKQTRTAKPKGSKPRQRSSGSDEKRMRTGKGAGEKLGNAFGEVAGQMMVPMKQIHDAYRQLSKKGRATGKKKK